MLSPRIQRLLLSPRFVLGLYLLLTLVITFQHYLRGPESYNNYLIFVKPYFNLLAGKNLYLPYPEYYQDTYKYSPFFALCMAPFALAPTWLGLLAWNALNNAVFYTAGRRLFPDVRRQTLFLLLTLLDVLTALHNSQANCLLVGLMLWTYLHLEAGKAWWAGLCLALATLIKVYGIGIGLLFLFYPLPIRNGLRAGLWLVVLALAPRLVVSTADFLLIYQGWFAIVRASATGIQLSLMGVLEAWFGVAPTAKGVVQGVGLLLLLLPAAYVRYWHLADSRRLYVASILIFVVIFNQMAESPTYIIAVAGFMFWYILYRRSTRLSGGLLVLVLVFTTLSATDLCPSAVREAYFDVYKLKAVPMILAWTFIQSQLLLFARWQSRLAAAAPGPAPLVAA